jgi:hypothetical protein
MEDVLPRHARPLQLIRKHQPVIERVHIVRPGGRWGTDLSKKLLIGERRTPDPPESCP